MVLGFEGLVAAVCHSDVRHEVLFLKDVVGGLEALPKIEVSWLCRFHALLSHAKREDVDGDAAHVTESRFDYEIDFLNDRISHGETANAAHVTMDHDEIAGALVGEVVGVRIADVEGQVVAAGGIELLLCDAVEAFRSLHVSFAGFGPQSAGETGDGVGAKKMPLSLVVLQPQLEFAAFFENADEDGLTKLALAGSEFILQFGQQPCAHISEAFSSFQRLPCWRWWRCGIRQCKRVVREDLHGEAEPGTNGRE